MRQSIPKIRSIKMKDGGAEIYVVPKKVRDHHAEVCKEIAEATVGVLEQNDDLVGFSLVVWDTRGGFGSVYYISEESPISSDMLARYVQDALKSTVLGSKMRRMLED